MRKQLLFSLMVVMVILVGGWIALSTIQETNQDVVRKISGLPSGQYWWRVETYKEQIFIIDGYGNKVDITGKRDLDPQSPFYVALIDPNTERIVEEFTTKHWRAVAISAEREQRPDSWLAQDYDFWVFDSRSNTAYALKPVRWEEWTIERYTGIHVIDIQTRQLKKFIQIPYIGTIALHPNQEKFYVSTTYNEENTILVFSTVTLELIKTLPYESDTPIWDMKFTKDGEKLFCCVYGRGLLILDAINDIMSELFNFDLDWSFSIALSSDEKELYAALRLGREYGGVAAIDVAQRKLVRVLRLTTGCTSVAVVGDKLFAACLDGVYVIDIPAWRKQQ